MIKNIIIISLIIAAIFLLSYYYKSSSLTLNSKGVTLVVKNKTIFIDGRHVKMTPLTFSNLNIIQSKLSNGAYYEVSTCESLYEFNPDTKSVIRTIFEAKDLDELFSIRGVRAIRVTLQNSQIINLFVDDNDMKALKIFYGISYDEYAKIVKEVLGKEFKEFSVGGMLELPMAMTKWSVIHNNFNGVISSIDY